MSDKRVALWYVVMLIPTIAASIALTSGLLMAGNTWLPRSQAPVYGVVFNIVPPVLIGAAIYFVLARHFSRRAVHRRSQHFYRAAPLYITAVALVSFVVANRTSPGFELVAQLFVWPALAFLAAIPTEAVTWRISTAQAAST